MSKQRLQLPPDEAMIMHVGVSHDHSHKEHMPGKNIM